MSNPKSPNSTGVLLLNSLVMFLRKVLFLSTVQAEVECYVVDGIFSHDVCYVASYLIVCLFRKSYGVTRH